ncbi:MAG: trehalase family glycosidase [bacterium]
MSCMPGSGNIWQWDSCFMAMFSKYMPGVMPGYNNLDNLYRMQDKHGYISMAYVIENEKEAYGELINPPLYAWAEWQYYRVTGDKRRLAKCLPVLTGLFDWLKANRRRKDVGLYWFEVPGSSGMDNAPRGGRYRDGSGMAHVDLSAQQALSARCLAQIATALGKKPLAARFEKEFAELGEIINTLMWSEKTGFYHDIFDDDYRYKNIINSKTVAGFWPLLAGIATHGRADRLIEHLLNPAEFWRKHPVPSLSADDPNYDSLGAYWRGGVWAPTNYMVVKGLEQHGRRDLAFELAVKHMENLCEVYSGFEPSSLWECYSPDLARPATAKLGELSRSNFVGWTGLGPVAMLIEDILGVEVDVPANTITWRPCLLEEHGIKRLAFGKGYVDLLCESRQSRETPPTVRVSSTVPFKLRVEWVQRQAEKNIRIGDSILVPGN